ncbi:hypothetical protein PL321_03680 [Caloramator sp. mosi_1]|uniref:hypothetical protein n=1 Tax=Caloramator sp. mosi_1 TaxID=3023090 RepID=UPI00235E99B0|nr:hypothetical protein [Caloramator sp. mosi_1]WDC84756.1 hypothetical protein PL321_03680 [Caloramator sp. mosi_1]
MFLLIIIFILLIILSIINLYSYQNNKVKQKSISEFLKVKGYIAGQVNESYIINLFYFYSGYNKLINGIEKIEFVGVDGIEFESLKVNEQVVMQEFILTSIPVKIKFNKKVNT